MEDEDKEDNVNDSRFVRSSLAGFTNQFKPVEERLPIQCKFTIHKDSDEACGRNFFVEAGEFSQKKISKLQILLSMALGMEWAHSKEQ